MLFDRKGGGLAPVINTGHQSQSKVAVLTDGGYVIAWHSGSSPFGDPEGVRVQRFNALDQRVGPEIVLNNALPAGTRVSAPDVVALPNGAFAVAWIKTVDGVPEYRIRSFNADGTTLAAESAVPGTAGGSPALAPLAGGGFVIAWHRTDFVEAQVYGSGGLPVGPTLLVDSGPFFTISPPAVAGLADGRFVVAWWEGGSSDIKARLFNADGTAVAGEFTVNTGLAGRQTEPAVAALEGGGFVVAWSSSDGASGDVYAQMFNSAGIRVGPETLVNTAVAGFQGGPDVTALPGGGFLVAWSDSASLREGGITASAILGQAFDSAGAKVGVEFPLSASLAGGQFSPSLATLPGGEVISIWTDSRNLRDLGQDIYGQRLKPHSTITDIVSTATIVSEVAFVNSVLGTLSSNAAINGGVTYEIVADSSGGAFRIVGNKLVVDRNAALDHESAPSVSVTIRATEAGGLSYDEQLTVAVSNSVGELRYLAEDASVFFDPASSASALVTRLSTGNYLIVVQESNGSVGTVQARTFNDSGNGVGPVMTLPVPVQGGAKALVALQDGGFALSWAVQNGFTGNVQTSPFEDVMMQRFDASGSPLGPAVMVNTTVAGAQNNPHMTMLADGSLLVAWYDGYYAGGQQPTPSLRGQLFAPSGERTGGEFFIMDPAGTATGSELTFALASLPGGGFLATWHSLEGGNEIKFQLFDSAGNRVGPQLQANTTISGLQLHPAVAVLSSGGFVISWTDYSGQGGDFSSASVKAQRFDALGAKIGGEFLVNTVTNYQQTESQVLALPTGGFLISWSDYSTGTGSIEQEYRNLKAQLFTETGVRVGSEFQINELSQNYQSAPALAAGPSGSFIALWSDTALAYDSYVSSRVYPMVTPGTSADDVMPGTAGSDILEGLAGNDRLEGGVGNDRLDGGAGDDEMVGGLGNDTYWVDSSSDTVVELASQGVDEIRTTLASFNLADVAFVENLTGLSNDSQTLTGTGFSNALTGGGGDDLLDGLGGNDRLDGGAGVDEMRGGLGHDIFWVDSHSDIVVELSNEGVDEIRTGLSTYSLASFAFVENLTGLSALGQWLTGNGIANVLTGAGGSDRLDGGEGADTLDGGAGADDMRGGPGADIYFVDSSSDSVVELSNEGVDEIRTSLASYSLASWPFVENLTGLSSLGQTLTGNAGSNALRGGSGNDTLNGGTNADSMSGGLGNDVYLVDHAGDGIIEAAGEGIDEIRTSLASYSLAALPNVENLSALNGIAHDFLGNGANNFILGGTGDDVLNGGVGADRTQGGLGNDIHHVDNAGDVAIELADQGADTVVAAVSYALSANVENLQALNIGGTDPLSLTGNGLANFIWATQGNNIIDGAGGVDFMIGYAGDDVYHVDHSGDLTYEESNWGADTVVASVNYRLGANIENLQALDIAGTAALALTGNGLNNFIWGTQGDNILDGAGGADFMLGYAGDDIYHVDHAGDIAYELDGGGTDTAVASISYTLAANVENLQALNIGGNDPLSLTGNASRNFIWGTQGDNVIDGDGGADLMIGYGGNDVYFVDNVGDVTYEEVGGGSDTVAALTSYALGANIENLQAANIGGNAALSLTGNDQNNFIWGTQGSNILSGRGGNDRIFGFAGADQFLFDTAAGSANADWLDDFQAGTDKILLDNSVFTALTDGALSSSAFVTGTSALDADDRIIFDAASGSIFYDADGNGAGQALLIAYVPVGQALTAADISVV